jgi:glycosyltransferase involved in cell wall biosynthesis
VTNKKILIIIPCYNEAQNIPVLLAELKRVKIAGCEIFPLFINDDSTDDTAQVLEKFGARYLQNPVNLGIGGTVQLGFMYAAAEKYDFAVQMDGDGQHPPSELHKLIEPLLKSEADVLIGSRFISKTGYRSTAIRRIGIRFFSALNKALVKIVVNDPTSGYRAYNQKAIEVLVKYYPDEYPEPESIVYLAHSGLKLKEVPVAMNERVAGKSSIRQFTTIYYMFKVTLNSIFLHLKTKFNG